MEFRIASISELLVVRTETLEASGKGTVAATAQFGTGIGHHSAGEDFPGFSDWTFRNAIHRAETISYDL